MEKRDNRAQANIITLVLIILLVIVSLIIVWNVVQPLIKRTSEGIGTSAFTTSLEIKEANLYITGGGEVTVKRGSGEGKIKTLKFIFYENGESVIVEKSTEIKELETKPFSFTAGEVNISVSKVSVVPIFEDDKAGMEVSEDEIDYTTPGLISWWKFDGNVIDSGSGGNDGTNNGAIFVSGKSGQALDFDGPGYNDYIDCGTDSSLDTGQGDFSISTWVKYTDNSNWYGIVSKFEDTPGNYIGFRFRVRAYTDGLYFSVQDDVDAFYMSSSGVAVNDGNWHHAVAVFNYDNQDDSKFYIDGVDRTGEITVGVSQTLTNDAHLLIGKGLTRYFSGTIDEVMIFNKALSENEITAVYNNQKK